ncbi:MAG TPA: two-component sensor histidine kinase [Pseudomonas sp.]|nr:two-component sensor histidine kinase [Pseudomonadales bacterium]MBF77774.1 two-component sensor histidine kinase [Pseudomonadales bacterium]MBU32178.1 two-component sensor histidine kinase [Pseudomonadales bacterium]HCA24547.1 two-component sensor histidine kinase [Pseudomonas sp.]|tara:strand:- start:145 stop:1485 length:1341 start_codon:yes stop_codon:yes gene_type:complete
MPALTDGKLTRSRRSLRLRILVALLLVFVLGSCLSAVHTYGTRDDLRRSILLLQARTVSEGYSADQPINALPRYHAGSEMEYTLYAPDGSLHSFADYMPRPRRLRLPAPEDRDSWWHWSPFGGQVINVPIALPDGSVLMVSRNDAAERAMLNQLLLDRLRHSVLFVIPLGLLATGLILALLHWTLRPVRRATALAAEIGPQAPDQRIPLADLPREVQPLADAANRALDRLASAYDASQRFIADAAHELRTPLTVLDLRLQDARRSGNPDWPALEQEMRQLTRLVEQLLALARQDEGQRATATGERTALSRLVREVAASLLPLFEEQQRALEVAVEDGLQSNGQAEELRQALVNLLENALLHGQGKVRLQARRNGQWVEVSVGDEGQGVPPVQQEAMFERFRKGRQGSSGTGLGLPIVRRVVENAGGSVRFDAALPSTLRLSLPAAD